MAKKRVDSEKKFRAHLMATAKRFGGCGELQAIFDKYDKALLRCTNEIERQHIGVAGAAEIHRLFACPGNLVVNGQMVIPALPGFEDVGGKFKKL